MLKYAWLLAGLLILCTCFQNATTRTAAGSAHPQQLNGIAAAGAPHEPAAVTSGASSPSSALWTDLSLVYRIYKQCALDNLSVCLKVKLLSNLEQALRSSKILKLVEGVQFIKTGAAESDGGSSGGGAGAADAITPAFSNEKELEAVLPRAVDAKEQVLNSMIFKKLATFLQEHTLQVKFPDVRSANHVADNTVESRKKKDKKGGGGAYIMIPLLLGGTFIPIAYGALAMLAGKALIVSKLALVLASIIGIKKLLGGGGGGKESSHEVVVSSGGHSGWGRDMDLAAYSGWKPAKDNVKNM